MKKVSQENKNEGKRLLPSNWSKVKLNKIIKALNAGVSVNSEDTPANDDQYGVLKTSAVFNGTFYPNENKTIRLDEIKRAKVNPVEGSIIISRMNTPELVGEIGYVDKTYGNLFLPDRLWQTELADRVSGRWLANLLTTWDFKRQLKNIATGTSNTMKNISQWDFLSLKIPYPPYEEQQKIADVLETWDRAIELKESLIKEKEEQIKGLMEKLFEPDEHFKNVKLGEISQTTSGGTPRRSVKEYYNGDIPWVVIADITRSGKYLYKTKDNLTEKGLNNSTAKIYPKNVILYAMYASIGECTIAKKEVASNQAILCIKVEKNVELEFIYYYLSSLKEKIRLQGQQGAQSNLNAGMIRDFDIPLPPLPEQKRIANILSTADREIELLKQEVEQLNEQKKGLMQLLLTGIIRVKGG